jgi:hypothetical protein
LETPMLFSLSCLNGQILGFGGPKKGPRKIIRFFAISPLWFRWCALKVLKIFEVVHLTPWVTTCLSLFQTMNKFYTNCYVACYVVRYVMCCVMLRDMLCSMLCVMLCVICCVVCYGYMVCCA